jgi:hypothetical protein
VVLTVFLAASAWLGAAENETHWSLKPVTRPNVPAVANRKWKARNPIDPFIFAKLAEVKLSPSSEASRRTLIRRLYFDLIGLPPTPTEVTAFEKDTAPDAYEKVVERLLASPQYGERWAQHWLDVVRFAETHGFEMNQPRATAWRYRDYVIEAFNADKPYDRFIMEQFAGDVFGEDTATGFLVAGPWDQVKSPDPVLTAAQRADELHDMVSTTGSAFLGLTVGCARCHNHKFDPVPQADYYAIKACLAGVQHGERKLRTPDLPAREAEAERARKKLSGVEAALTRFEPIARTGRFLSFEPEPTFGSRTAQLLKPAARVSYPKGTARGERDDPGDLSRPPNFSRNYLAWSNSANANVFACEPGVDGRFRVWVSWGCGSETFAKDAQFLLDRDGDLTTTEDQAELARVDEQHFADGTGEVTTNRLWSGFYDGGVWDLSASNKIIVRGGASDAVVTAGVLALVEEPEANGAIHEAGHNQPAPSSGESLIATASAKTAVTGSHGDGGGDSLSPGERAGVRGNGSSNLAAVQASPQNRPGVGNFLRAPVNARRNVERFIPVKAKRLRFAINRTSDAEPCIDELEVYTAGTNPTNIALANAGTKASCSSVFPNSDIHRLEHINDGKFGNSRSWISNERGKGWVELEFPEEVMINRVIWERDREQKFSDRLTLDYRIEVATGSNDWHLVASSQDRVPYVGGRAGTPDFSRTGLAEADVRDLDDLLAQRGSLEARVKDLANVPMVYAGSLTNNPEPTYRLQRGDAMQKREVIEPGTLSVIPIGFHFDREASSPSRAEGGGEKPSLEAEKTAGTALTEDQQRRLALAKWIVDANNPLPARVLVNRLWQHHFGEGLVATPSDFGKKGALPTHPELLDWLAAELVKPAVSAYASEPARVPWSIKHMHRLIVTSAAYRQATIARREGLALDAGSRLLWRFPPQRLEAESLRDSILAVSGKLDLRAGGPGFSVFENNDNYVRVYNAKKEFGPPEWRRMVYMTKVRMQQDATFGAFDCPDGGQITPKRMRSTTPLQALNLMNSEFILQQAGFLAARLEKDAGKEVGDQVRLAFELVYSRPPDAQEIRAAKALIAEHGMTIFCRALFNSNEFIFLE